jgi:hypothetical protein
VQPEWWPDDVSPSPAATLLLIPPAGQASSAGAGKAAATVDEAGLVDALLRYCYYHEVGIDARHVAPFREEWLGNALSMVPNQPPPNVSDVSSSKRQAVQYKLRLLNLWGTAVMGTCASKQLHRLRAPASMHCVPASNTLIQCNPTACNGNRRQLHAAAATAILQAFYDQFISSAMHEVRADYSKAMQRAMLDYVLSNPLERQRLGLQGLEPLLVPRHGLDGPLGPPLGSASQQRLVQRQLPQEWHEHVALAR